MSIQSEINRIKSAVASAYSSVASKGGTVPASKTAANLSGAINSIPSGSGAEVIPLTATENGTYTAPSGKAYSPVTVAIPTYDGSVS